jgi:hypothetical protein
MRQGFSATKIPQFPSIQQIPDICKSCCGPILNSLEVSDPLCIIPIANHRPVLNDIPLPIPTRDRKCNPDSRDSQGDKTPAPISAAHHCMMLSWIPGEVPPSVDSDAGRCQ